MMQKPEQQSYYLNDTIYLALRYATIGAIALTGIGLVYLFSRMVFVEEGYKGLTYKSGELNTLDPGVHVLLSPFNYFQGTHSVAYRVTEFAIDDMLTPDRTPLKLKAILTWRVNDPEMALRNVHNYQSSLINVAKATLTNILRHVNLDLLLSAKTESDENDMFKQINQQFISQLSEDIDNWGIEVCNMKIDDILIPDVKISEALAEQSAAKSRAVALETLALAEANAKKIKADAEIAVARSCQEASKELQSPQAIEVYRLGILSKMAKESGATIITPADTSVNVTPAASILGQA